jgi:hypothetical protein
MQCTPNLKDYITEAVSHGYRKSGMLKEPIQKDDLIFWLRENGYTGNWDFSDRTGEALKRKSKMYCEITGPHKAPSVILCITNGDGENEYRLFFDRNKGYELTSMAIVKELYGRMDIFNVLCDSEGIAVLKDWLTGAVRESVSGRKPITSKRYFQSDGVEDINYQYDSEDIKTVLEMNGYKELDHVSFLDNQRFGQPSIPQPNYWLTFSCSKKEFFEYTSQGFKNIVICNCNSTEFCEIRFGEDNKIKDIFRVMKKQAGKYGFNNMRISYIIRYLTDEEI